jgi:hypothetical protein
VKPQTRKHPTCGYFRSGPCRGSDTPANRPSSFAEVRTGFCTARTHVGSAEQIRVVELHLVGEDVCVYVFAVTARLRWPTFWPIVAHGTPARCKRLILRWRRSCGLNVGTPAAVQARLNRGAQPVRCHVLEHAPIRVAIVARAELEYLNRTTPCSRSASASRVLSHARCNTGTNTHRFAFLDGCAGHRSGNRGLGSSE